MKIIQTLANKLSHKKSIFELQGRKWLFERSEDLEKDCYSIVNYNILAEDYLFEQLYSECDPNNLKIENRKLLIQNELIELKPNIILFQELEKDKYDYYKKLVNSFGNEVLL